MVSEEREDPFQDMTLSDQEEEANGEVMIDGDDDVDVECGMNYHKMLS